MADRIPYGRQHISKDDINAVVETLTSDFLTQGPKIKEFEENFANYVGSKFAVAVSNGTAALHIASKALGVKQGSRVITTPITFVASANGVKYCDGDIEFVDIDPNTYLIDINQVEKLLENNPSGTFQGIIPVNFTGRVVKLKELRTIADKYGLWIIEDAAHSPGGAFVDNNGDTHLSGNGDFADLSIFSFHPVKHIAAGEGGMITTNNEQLYKKLLRLRSHGITFEPSELLNSPDIAFQDSSPDGYERSHPLWYMEMQELGFNYRITDIQCALANSQLQRADAGLKRRREIAQIYFEAFRNKNFIIGQSGVIEGHAYHLYVIEVPKRAELHKYLREHGVFSQIHYIPAHLMPYYQKQGYRPGDFPNAEKYYKHCISLPMYPTLKLKEQNKVIELIEKFYD